MILIALLCLFALVAILLAPLYCARKRGAHFFAKRNLPLIASAFGVPIGALFFYLLLGSMPAYLQDQRLRLAIEEQGASAVLHQNLHRLEEQLVLQPEHKKIRADLARAYFLLGRLDKAQRLMSHPSMQEEEEYLALALRLHYAAGDWDKRVEELSARLASLNDHHPVLLSLKAHNAYQEEDYENAISLWRQLLALGLSAAEEERVRALIQQARSR